MPQTVRDRIFVSYSHKDEAWLDRFRTMLQPAQRATGLQLWSDKRIEAGASWKDEIETAIDTARIALLLVSDDFLASDFIFNEELPRILQQHQSRGLMIRWVPLTAALVFGGLALVAGVLVVVVVTVLTRRPPRDDAG